MPTASGKSQASALIILVYTIFLIPISLFPIIFTSGNITLMAVVAAVGLGFTWYAIQLYSQRNDQAALKLMFASFVYLPIIQLLYLI